MTSAALAPARFAYRVRTIASFVLLEPVPAITGTRPSAASRTVSMTRSCSSKESVADSPVVPHGTIPSVPFRIWNSTSFLSAVASSLPFRNGVTVATMAPWNIRFPPFSVTIRLFEDLPVARPGGVPLEEDLPEIIPIRIEMDGEDLPAARPDGHRRRGKTADRRQDRAGDRPRPARQRLALDPALIGAHPQTAVFRLDEVDVGSPRGERLVPPDPPPDSRHVDPRDVGDEQDGVGNAGVEERIGELSPPERQRTIDGQPAGPRHLELHAPAAHGCVKDPRERLEGHLPARDPAGRGEARHAPPPVAAHLGVGTVGVVEVPPDVRPSGRLDPDPAVGADRAGPVAHLRDEGRAVDAAHHVMAVVDQEEVVAAPVQFRKRYSLPRHPSVPSFDLGIS